MSNTNTMESAKLIVLNIPQSPKKINTLIPKEITLTGDTTILKSGLVSNLEFTKVNLPTSIEVIDTCAFVGCYGLEEITLPEECEVLGSGSFMNCISLKSIYFNDKIKIIKKLAFYNCTRLRYVKIPAQIKEIHIHCFAMCTSLKRLEVPRKCIFKFDNGKIIHPQQLNKEMRNSTQSPDLEVIFYD